MFQFPGGIGLGVDIGDLLELQGAFEGNRVVQAPADEEDILAGLEILGKVLDLRLGVQDLLHLPRQFQETATTLGARRPRCTPVLRQVNPQQIQAEQLRGIGLGGSDGDLRPGQGQDQVIGLPRDRTADHIGNGQDPGT